MGGCAGSQTSPVGNLSPQREQKPRRGKPKWGYSGPVPEKEQGGESGTLSAPGLSHLINCR